MTNTPKDSEYADQLHLHVSSRDVTRLLIDYAITLQIDMDKETLWITLETKFSFTNALVTYVIDPENRADICHALAILHQALDTVTATNQGRLTITFQSGDQIVSVPDEAYEAWNLRHSSSLLVIARPGGGIDYFAPTKDKI